MDVPKINGATSTSADALINGGKHGQAALLLVESLMHHLVSKGLISREDFIEIVQDAAEVECALGGVKRSSPSDLSGSLLHPLSAAFRQELGR